MARKGAMAKNPPLRGAARKEFRAAQREAVASGGPMPTQDKFRQPPQTRQDRQRVSAPQAGQSLEQIAGQVAGQMPPDKMMRFPQPGNQAGAALGAAMEGAGMGNIAGSRSEGSPVFNAFPGNNPANLNDANIGRFSDIRTQGGDYRSMVMPGSGGGYDEFGQFVPPGQQGQMSPETRQRVEQMRQQMFQQIPPGQIQDAMFRSPGVPMKNIPGMNQGFQNGLGNFAQMPQPSANNGGKYRLSPGVYGTKEQAMKQWAMQPAVPGAVNAPGSMSQIDLSQAVPYEQRRR